METQEEEEKQKLLSNGTRELDEQWIRPCVVRGDETQQLKVMKYL